MDLPLRYQGVHAFLKAASNLAFNEKIRKDYFKQLIENLFKPEPPISKPDQNGKSEGNNQDSLGSKLKEEERKDEAKF